MSVSPDERIKNAIEVAGKFGHIDGAHHKMWTIDQIVRILTGCPVTADVQGEATTHEYQAFRKEFIEDDDGESYDHWDEGISP